MATATLYRAGRLYIDPATGFTRGEVAYGFAPLPASADVRDEFGRAIQLDTAEGVACSLALPEGASVDLSGDGGRGVILLAGGVSLVAAEAIRAASSPDPSARLGLSFTTAPES